MRYLLMLSILCCFLSCSNGDSGSCGYENCSSWESCVNELCILKEGFCNQNSECDSNVCQEDHTCKSVDSCNCKAWEECNNNSCELTTGKCNEKSDCNEADMICGGEDSHTCIKESGFDCSSCESWQQCNEENSACVLKEGFCDDSNQCPSLNCRNDHTCEPVTTCDCKAWEVCNNNNCELAEGKCNEKSDCSEADMICGGEDSHTCIFDCSSCESWQECNGEATSCVLSAGKCVTDGDCNGEAGFICEGSDHHTCIDNSSCDGRLLYNACFTDCGNSIWVAASDYQNEEGAQHYPWNAVDGDIITRWSAEGEQWIEFQFPPQDISRVGIAFYVDNRQSFFTLKVSSKRDHSDGVVMEMSGVDETLEIQYFELTEVVHDAIRIRIEGHGNSKSNWNSYTEVVWDNQ